MGTNQALDFCETLSNVCERTVPYDERFTSIVDMSAQKITWGHWNIKFINTQNIQIDLDDFQDRPSNRPKPKICIRLTCLIIAFNEQVNF